MPNIIKGAQLAERVLDYGFTRTFEDIILKEEIEEQKEEPFREEVEDKYLQAAEVYENALRQAQEMTDQAREEAEKIRAEAREEGHQEGYDAGFEEGYRKAYEDHKAELDLRMDEFRDAMRSTIEGVTVEKDKILEKYMDDLKKITLTIAEKVIQTSLKSSGEIIKRMIVTAAGKLKKTQWVKIYVSQKDAGMMIQGDVGLLNELSHISGNIKIIAMDHAEDGSCIIELPEEIIDVGVNTQLENIKGILNNARL
ncbi:FliH/SctL family protein [Clostridium sp. Marseille-P2415]|uniref:FliH/SctL family protein n=1 Tax=Clostridium sp. Marseille-P2415 TaxID=1805471 RepID=UPI003FA43A18